MIEKYGLFDSLESDVREYAEADFALLVKALGEDGVRGGSDALRVSPAASGLGVSVAQGLAIVQGRYYALADDGSGAMTLSLTAASAYPRIDRIVLVLNYAQRTVRLSVLKGTEAVSPVAPALTRNASEYMLSLASVYVGVGVGALSEEDVTDERSDAALCGMTGTAVEKALNAAQAAQSAAEQAQRTAQTALDNAGVTSVGGKTGDVALKAGEGIGVDGVTVTNAGVRAVSQGSAEGTIRVNTNGAEQEVQVKGWTEALEKKMDASMIQCGAVSVEVSQYADDSTNLMKNIYTAYAAFPVAMGKAPSAVLVSTVTTDPLRRRCSVNNVTQNGFDCCVYNGTSAGTVWVYWLAIWN